MLNYIVIVFYLLYIGTLREDPAAAALREAPHNLEMIISNL